MNKIAHTGTLFGMSTSTADLAPTDAPAQDERTTFLHRIFAHRLFPAAMISTAMVLAFFCRFIQDDAFISFRYSRSLIEGHGLTWNPGERIEGYTNFLWTLLMAIPHALGLDPVPISMSVGLILLGVSLAATWRLGRLLDPTGDLAPTALIVLGTNYTFLAYATGGLETQLQSAIFVLLFLLTTQTIIRKRISGLQAFCASLLTAAGMLTRLDSILVAGICFIAMVVAIIKIRPVQEKRLTTLLLLVLPGGLAAGALICWKWHFYGALLPATFYAKGTGTHVARGAYYLYSFAKEYALLPFVCLAILTIQSTVKSLPFRLILIATGLWFLYVMKVGGDFMEYRLVVPVLPLFILLVVRSLTMFRTRLVVAVLVMGSVIASIAHAKFYTTDSHEIESIRELSEHLYDPSQNWKGVGSRLGDLFSNAQPPLVIATTAAGAIPYYSRLNAVDMLGLTDPQVVQHGIRIGDRPGHSRVASLPYLRERGVHLVIGHPQVRKSGGAFCSSVGDLGRMAFQNPDAKYVPKGTPVVQMRLDGSHVLYMLYINRHPRVDELVAKGELTLTTSADTCQ